jgi:predicted double-glycine peptidase
MQAWDETPDKEKTYKKLGSGHYVVVIGYDDNYVYFEDPVLEGERGVLTYDEFAKRWHDKDRDGKVYHRFGLVLWKGAGITGGYDTQLVSKKRRIP